MKRIIASAMAMTLAFGSLSTYAQPSQNAAEIQSELEEQKVALEGLQEELRVLKSDRKQMVILTIGLSALSVVAALPGIKIVSARIKMKAPVAGSPAITAPAAPTMKKSIAVVGAPLLLAVAATDSYATVRLASSDITVLEKKVAAKLAEIAKAERLLQSVK